MKSLPLIIVLLVSLFLVSNQYAKAKDIPLENTEINLQIEGGAYQWIYLQGIHKNVKSKLDSAWLDNEGKGLLKYDQPLDPGYYNLLLSEEVSFPILVDQDQTFSLQTDAEQLIKNMQVEGSTENTLLYKNLQFDIELQERFQAEVQLLGQVEEQPLEQAQIDQLRKKYFAEKADFLSRLFREYPNTLFVKYEKAKQEPDNLYAIMSDPSLDPAVKQERVLSTYWDQVDFSDERLLRTPVIYDKLWQYFNQFVPDQTDIKIQAADVLMQKVTEYPAYYAFFAAWLTDDYLPPFNGNMDPDALYVHMVDTYLTEDRAVWADSIQVYAWQLRAKIQRGSLVGNQAINFTAQTPSGETQALDDIQSPYVALFFYHYDCDHCVETTPKLVQRYQSLKEQGLEVLAIAMDTPQEEWLQFIQKNEMDWINVTDQDNPAIYDHYNVRATPEIMLLNPDRTIIGKHLAVEDVAMLMQADQRGMFKK